ncbi:transposase [Vagococcus lutrae]|uniref:transposase n=1 Tax=Vagococcus lutrae TaxID=81947 RepID=UPI002096E19D|nr:transposase [Vagococcus lutrae]MCO7151334.1 transposase [Vagococcus lutrae]MDT2813019.1 transposase [Vagococcus lutrae]MDT2820035.1 transposase [Vagococcus lutrae]MDT2844973.1 transposase [Vagococcus lutrae]WCG05815.1 transposase [Vagococcus lutrae]
MRYEESFKQHCVNLVVKEGRTKASVTKEFNLSQGIIKRWIDVYEALQSNTQADLEKRQRELEKENKLLKKENDFLKKRPPSLPRTKTFKIFIYSTTSSRIWYQVVMPEITSIPLGILSFY